MTIISAMLFLQKTVMKWQKPEPQFRDYLFNVQLDLTLKATNQAKDHPTTWIPRLTWTNKVKRRELNKHKINNFDKIFGNTITSPTPLITQSRSQSPRSRRSPRIQQRKVKMNNTRAMYSPQNGTETKDTRKNQCSMSHFVISRNLMPKEVSDDLSKSGILIEKYQRMVIKEEERGRQSPKHLLKSLNMRENINIYKGNFIKFTKKGLKKTTCRNRCQETSESQLTPWDNAEKSPTCFR